MYTAYRHPNAPFQKAIDRLCALIGDQQLSDIRQHTLVDASNELHPGTSPGTKNRQVLVVASAVLHYAAENNLCPYIRIKKFKEKAPEPRALNKTHAKALIEAADGNMKLLLVWLFHQGWRISDVLRVVWQDINLKEGTVRYHISKTDDWRVMPLHPKVHELLAKVPTKVGRLFHWTDKSNLYRDLRPFCQKLGIYFTPHMARHSFATWLANEGVSPLEIMEAGGWKDHKSVMRYAKLDPTRVRAVIGKI
jgi:integrase